MPELLSTNLFTIVYTKPSRGEIGTFDPEGRRIRECDRKVRLEYKDSGKTIFEVESFSEVKPLIDISEEELDECCENYLKFIEDIDRQEPEIIYSRGNLTHLLFFEETERYLFLKLPNYYLRYVYSTDYEFEVLKRIEIFDSEYNLVFNNEKIDNPKDIDSFNPLTLEKLISDYKKEKESGECGITQYRKIHNFLTETQDILTITSDKGSFTIQETIIENKNNLTDSLSSFEIFRGDKEIFYIPPTVGYCDYRTLG